MNKLFVVFSMGVLLVTASFALAANGDGADLYKSSCSSCHGEQGEKGGEPLKGQDSDTIMKKLNGYRDGTYGGSKKQVMQSTVKRHSDDDLKKIADFIGTLK